MNNVNVFIPLSGVNRDRVIASGKNFPELIAWLGNSERWFGEAILFFELLLADMLPEMKQQLRIPDTIDPNKHTQTVKGFGGVAGSPLKHWGNLVMMTRGGRALILSPTRVDLPAEAEFNSAQVHLYEILYPNNSLVLSNLKPTSFGLYKTDTTNNPKGVKQVVFQEISYDFPCKYKDRLAREKAQLETVKNKKSKLIGGPQRLTPSWYYATDGIWVVDPEGCDKAVLYEMEPFENRLEGDNRGFWKSNLLDMEG